MGSLCGKEEATSRASEEKKPKKREPMGSIETHDTAGSQFDNEMINMHRRSTKYEKSERAAHFLSFKEQMKFKKVESFSEHY